MKYYLLLVTVLLIFTLGCSKDVVQFDDDLLKFKVEQKKSNGVEQSFSIKVKNNGTFTMKNTLLFLDFPIKIENGYKNNPFKIEGKYQYGLPHLIKPGEEVEFQILVPDGEILDESKVMLDSPHIEFRGLILSGDEEIPFGISSSVRALDPDYQ